MSETTIEVNFDAGAIATLEEIYVAHIEDLIKKKYWVHHYYDAQDQRKFTIVFVQGESLEIRGLLSTTLTLFIKGVNVFPGGKYSLTDPQLAHNVIKILEKCHDKLLKSDLILRRDVVTFKADFHRLQRTTFNYPDIPDDEIFCVPQNECELVGYEFTVKMLVRDIVYGNEVLVSSKNEPNTLTNLRARAKLFALRQVVKDE